MGLAWDSIWNAWIQSGTQPQGLAQAGTVPCDRPWSTPVGPAYGPLLALEIESICDIVSTDGNPTLKVPHQLRSVIHRALKVGVWVNPSRLLLHHLPP